VLRKGGDALDENSREQQDERRDGGKDGAQAQQPKPALGGIAAAKRQRASSVRWTV
jgi:hypothetical protein